MEPAGLAFLDFLGKTAVGVLKGKPLYATGGVTLKRQLTCSRCPNGQTGRCVGAYVDGTFRPGCNCELSYKTKAYEPTCPHGLWAE